MSGGGYSDDLAGAVRRITKQIEKRQTLAARDKRKELTKAANKTLVPAIKSEAPEPRIRKSVNARRGKTAETVVVGPRGGKRGAFYRAWTVGGTEPHFVGKAVEAGWRSFTSAKKAAIAHGQGRTDSTGLFRRRHKGRGRAFMSNIGYPGKAMKREIVGVGPWKVGGITANPFVERGIEKGEPSFLDEITRRFLAITEEE